MKTIRWMTHPVAGVLALAVCLLGGGADRPASAAVMPPDYGFQWATITHPGNAPYSVPPNIGQPRTVGRVDYTYRISKTEMSAADWAPFANANLRIGDPWEIGLNAYFSQVLDIGPGGVLQPRTDIPLGNLLSMSQMSWYDAARYCNWLHNGKSETRESMEYGAYDLRGLGLFPRPLTPPTRLPGATFFLPTVDEWIKAMHYDPDRFGPDNDGYWLYPHSSDDIPIPGPRGEGETNAGYYPSSDPTLAFRIGAYPNSVSPWGLLDGSGGVSEWLEDVAVGQIGTPRLVDGWGAFYPGGGGDQFSPSFDHIGVTGSVGPNNQTIDWLGFRIASVPTPGPVAIFATSLTTFTLRRHRRYS